MVIMSLSGRLNANALATFGSLLLLLLAVIAAFVFSGNLDIYSAFSTRLSGLPQLLTLLGSDVSDVSILDSWKRPLLTIDQALPRFLTSPILGTGFSAGKIEPLDWNKLLPQ